jgi:hypothetical protein
MPWRACGGLRPQPKEVGPKEVEPKQTKKAEKKEQSEQACFFPFLLRSCVSFGEKFLSEKQDVARLQCSAASGRR